MLKIENLTAKIQEEKKEKTILKNVNIEFENGKVYAVMGPNGSGKSTLANVIMGHPAYSLNSNSKIIFNGKSIKNLPPEKRAKLGIFMAFQNPLSLSGVNIYQMLKYALSDKKVSIIEIKELVDKYAKKLKIQEELLERSLNEGFSGGEKKKMEALQAIILNPKVAIFDEIDTGVDVDALKLISKFLKEFQKDKIYIVITHYNRILKYLKPDKVIVIKQGEVAKIGDKTLATLIERKGYDII
ncbi:Vegetative protein 296 [bacterium HR34]|nr:Vegetative protein 296 [bacterium HR34]